MLDFDSDYDGNSSTQVNFAEGTYNNSTGEIAFIGLDYTVAGTFALRASATSYPSTANQTTLSTDCSNTITLSESAPHHVYISNNIPNRTADQNFTMLTEIRDQFGNIVPTDNGRVVAAQINTDTSFNTDATLSNTTATTSSGSASLSNLHIDKVGSAYDLRIVSTGLTGSISNNFNISHGVGTQIYNDVSLISNTATAGQNINIGNIEVRDQYDNVATTENHTINLTSWLSNDCSTTSSSGNTTNSSKATTLGVTNINNYTHDKMESIYIKVASGSLTPVCTNAVAVDHAGANKIVVNTQPSSSATAGVNLATQPQFEIQDEFNNLVDDGNHTITLAAYTNSGCSSASSGTFNHTPDATASGLSSFTGINHQKMETIYLGATASGLNSTCTNGIAVDHNAANKIAVTTQPSTNATAGVNFSTQPTYVIRDVFDNLVDDGTHTITLAAHTNSGCSSPQAELLIRHLKQLAAVQEPSLVLITRRWRLST